MPVEVSCPGCGSKLKAPEERVGKNVRCKKCDTRFRIPGPSSPGDSLGEAKALSVISMPSPLTSDDEDVPMAAAVEVEPEPLPPPPPPARTADPSRDVASLPSADPFDFSSAPKAAPKAPAAGPPPPARPAFGAGKAAAPVAPPVPPPAAARPAAAAAPVKAPAASPPPAPPPAPAKAAVASPPPAPPPPPPAKAPAAKAPPAAPPAAKKPAPAPEPEPLPADDEPVPASAEPTISDAGSETAADPFAFSFDGDSAPAPEPKRKGRDRDHADDDEPRSKRKGRDRDDEDDEDDRPKGKAKGKDRKKADDDADPEEGERRYRPGDQKGGGKMLLIALLLGVGAIGAMVAAVVVMNNKAKEQEQAAKAKKEKEDKEKEDKEKELAATLTPTEVPKKDSVIPGKKDPAVPGKKDPVVPPKKEPEPKTRGEMLSLAVGIPSFKFTPAEARTMVRQATAPNVPVEIDAGKVRRVFVPEDRSKNDVVVVWQTAPGAGGKGEKLTADIRSGAAGIRVGRIDFDGDGKDVKCDVSADGKYFAAVGPDDKISVWDLLDKQKKVVDAYDPFVGKDEHKKHGLAAVFFTSTNTKDQLLTVTTAGAAHVHDTVMKKSVASFGPTGFLVPNQVALGKSVAADVKRTSIVLAVNGVVYQLDSGLLTTVWKIELGGEVGRSLGVAVYGNPGQIAYAFETDDKGKKEKAVLLAPARDPKPTIFRWPDAAGEPTGAAWAGTKYGVVGTDKGVVYFNLEGKKFTPFAFAELAGGRLPHAANESGHWYLVGDAVAADKAQLVQLSDDSLNQFHLAVEDKEGVTVKLDEKGLAH